MIHVYHIAFKENKVDIRGIVSFFKNPVAEQYDPICILYK